MPLAVTEEPSVRLERNLVYGKGGEVDLQLDLARPATGEGPFPALVFIHGGGWAEGSREIFLNQSEMPLSQIQRAAQRGYVAVTVSYRLTSVRENGKPKYPFPAQVFTRPPGDFSTLVRNGDGTYTLTRKDGTKLQFSSAGLMTARTDTNNNTTTYVYTDADGDGADDMQQITDPFGRTVTFAYSGGRLTTVTDYASRVTPLGYDGSNRLSTVTRPDPDGLGSLPAPVTSYTYTTDGLLERINYPDGTFVQYAYHSYHRRLTAVQTPSGTVDFDAVEVQGLPIPPVGTSSQNPAPLLINPANAVGTYTDPLDNVYKFATDRFGNVTKWITPPTSTAPEGITTIYERDNGLPNGDGLLTKLILPSPGPGGSTSEITYTYDTNGNVISSTLPDGSELEWDYLVFNGGTRLTSATDELGRVTLYGYDTNGNLTVLTDPSGSRLTFAYNHPKKLLTSITEQDGYATPGVYDPATSTYWLRDANAAGPADRTFGFSKQRKAVAGDWDGNGTSTGGLYDAETGQFYLRNSNSAGPADVVLTFGPTNSTWLPIAGDWNGDGQATVGLYDRVAAQFHLRNDDGSETIFTFGTGNNTWTAIAGGTPAGATPPVSTTT
ncbi:MAG: hypothetical protein HY000_17025 [Planctomycetes bacterium]|nr:hypothetical protein [Planctomycetota bacterium]